jgi:hypothetical protein
LKVAQRGILRLAVLVLALALAACNSPSRTPKPGSSTTSQTTRVGSAQAASLPPFTYKHYNNARFGFEVDVPSFFSTSGADPGDPESTNGDGGTWKWESHAEMKVWGMLRYDGLSIESACELPDGVKGSARNAQNDKCWATGTYQGRIYWKRAILGRSSAFAVELTYEDTFKKEFDALVAHISDSWRVPPSGPGVVQKCQECSFNGRCQLLQTGPFDVPCCEPVGQTTGSDPAEVARCRKIYKSLPPPPPCQPCRVGKDPQGAECYQYPGNALPSPCCGPSKPTRVDCKIAG